MVRNHTIIRTLPLNTENGGGVKGISPVNRLGIWIFIGFLLFRGELYGDYGWFVSKTF